MTRDRPQLFQPRLEKLDPNPHFLDQLYGVPPTLPQPIPRLPLDPQPAPTASDGSEVEAVQLQ